MHRQPLITKRDLRRARQVAYLLVAAGAILMVVGAVLETAALSPPAFMLALTGGLWLGRAEEAHARLRATDPV